MFKFSWSAIAFCTTSLLLASPSFASKALAEKKLCYTCHEDINKSIGPSFKQIFDKYHNQKDVTEKLIQRTIKGSTGVWGKNIMVANNINHDEAKQLIDWILTSKSNQID